MILLSHYQVHELIRARGYHDSVDVSPDLGLSLVKVQLGDMVCFPGEEPISWTLVEEIEGKKNNCFQVKNGEASSIQVFSEVYNRIYSLYPTQSAPTMLISGIPMHRIKDTDPWKDSQAKIIAFGKVGGQVLDTATGLGYTAILAAEKADRVISIELDPAARWIAKQNPWSQGIFESTKIRLMIGDSAEMISTFHDRSFDGIIHDPPMISMAGDLYSLEFYKEAFRVLSPNGRMFHYIGNPESTSGKSITQGVIKRLYEAGFSRVVPSPESFGVLAYKYRKMA